MIINSDKFGHKWRVNGLQNSDKFGDKWGDNSDTFRQILGDDSDTYNSQTVSTLTKYSREILNYTCRFIIKLRNDNMEGME